MSEPTLRTLTLNYYRQQGAQASPLDTRRRRWEIRLGDQKLDIAFDLTSLDPQTLGAQSGPEAVVPGSPKWREILADCAERGAVSYRHVVSAPIADPAGILSGILPQGWHIASYRLSRVATRKAVAFTHRVTYAAAAISGQPEELHHDVLDCQSFERIAELSENWATFATIPVGSPGDIPNIEYLHARALGLVDARSNERGRGIELSMDAKLADAERRLQQHYADLRAEVQAREVTDLTGRLTRVLDQIKTAAPRDLARLKADGATLAKRLDQAKKGKSVSIVSLEKIEAEAMAAERERHEVTITTELVGLCIVTFDEVTYDLDLAQEAGKAAGGDALAATRRISLEATYVPVTGEVAAPACQACGNPAVQPIVSGTGRYCCYECVRPCVGCGRTAAPGEEPAASCGSCAKAVCSGCGTPCQRCSQASCADHAARCGSCGDALCEACVGSCFTCAKPLCVGCSLEMHRRTYCADHILNCERCATEIPADLAQQCHITGTAYCVACALACVECGQVTRRELLQPASPRGLVCPDHLVPCATCQTSLLPREAALCASCNQYHCAHEAPACPECGLAACMNCILVEEGRCGVCVELQEVDATDPRLDPARVTAGPDVRRWLVAVAPSGHRVVEWHGKLGAWGRLALAPDGEIVSSCRYGAVGALWQEISGLIGR